MKIFPKVVMLSMLSISVATKNFVEVVTAVQGHFRSGCVYLLHEQEEGKSIFTFCVLTNELCTRKLEGILGVNNTLTVSIIFFREHFDLLLLCCPNICIFKNLGNFKKSGKSIRFLIFLNSSYSVF